MGYGSDGLRTGGTQSRGAGETAEAAAASMRGANCPSASFGIVKGADALAAALVRTRDAHVVLGEQVQRVQADLSVRAGSTADAGDGLTGATTTIAGSGGPTPS